MIKGWCRVLGIDNVALDNHISYFFNYIERLDFCLVSSEVFENCKNPKVELLT
jgi:hypothetical protein